MTIASALNNRILVRNRIVHFTSSGSYTPGPSVRAIDVTCTGGGGGSGGTPATGADQVAASGTGGGGGVVRRVFQRSQIIPFVSFTVGAGGAAGAAGPNFGGAGGSTQFLGMTAGGGDGGQPGAVGPLNVLIDGAAGGGASGGDFTCECPPAERNGIYYVNPRFHVISDPPLPITGFGAGASGLRQDQLTAAQSGVAGQTGAITIVEYLGF